MFTTVTQIGLDPGLLIGYGAGASLNLTLMIQGIVYRDKVSGHRLVCSVARACAAGGKSRIRRHLR